MLSSFQPDDAENSEDVPKSDDTNNIEIAGSVTLWEARPRPTTSAQVSFIHIKPK